ncbi:B12-binding domain-containing radical SAM protein [Acetobacterium woodii]|uniref:Cobalamin (Vitamin B12)-binding methylthiotransferase n=1 Tax=Acetobacterium woodii (strain ATCC 29683 / DSM 1030 / JCM 2381 / KCTC 1655 / WB1) TaxID=931626 RepID=H6LHM3_ACEWD|nr:radical SAM protein [Acetobacterium woodii]AFA47202.1 cobalamin (vitamin B12)-binding methylthiotransferase [Acetobacterium woodii DSM 1030]
MKILLCNVSQKYQTDAHDYVGLFYLAGALEKSGFQPLVFHGKPEKLLDEIKKNQPAAIGFSGDFDNVQLITELTLKIKKESDLPVIVGGPQSLGLKQQFLEKSQVDYILRGEGEESLPELLKVILKGEGELDKIKGLVYLKDGRVIETAAPAVIEDLDDLPLPAYHTSLHKNHHYGKLIFTGRGCPYQCAYCAPSPGKQKVRLRSIPLVLAEIKLNLKNNPNLNYLIIMDDTFTLNRERIEEFCRGMTEIRKERDLVWYCECHVGRMKDWMDILPTMIAAGLIRLQIGIESGDQQVIDQYNKHVKVTDIIEFVNYAADCGLTQIATNFIVGGPVEEAGATVKLIQTLIDKAPGVIDIITGFLRAYPGTQIRENPQKFDLQLHDESGFLSGDDYPFVTPKAKSQDQIMKDRQQLNKVIRQGMQKKIKNHELKQEAVMKQFKAALKYGIRSRWFEEISANPRAYEYYYVIYLNEGQAFTETLDFTRDYPQRTFELWRTMTFTEGFPKLDGMALSPLEYELLLRCAGKRSLNEIETELYGLFGGPYQNQMEFHGKLVDILYQFNFKYWLTHFMV